jgi:hypothetical protein
VLDDGDRPERRDANADQRNPLVEVRADRSRYVSGAEKRREVERYEETERSDDLRESSELLPRLDMSSKKKTAAEAAAFRDP